MTDGLETRRLLLQPLQLEDSRQVQPLFAQWEVVEFLNARVPWPYPDDGVFTYYRDDALPAIERGDEWHWTLRLRELPEQIIGAIGLMRSRHDRTEQTNRGFWLAPPWQGKGLMSEAVIAANDYWFDVLGFAVLRTSKAIANRGSRRISEKTGMRAVATYESEYVAGRLPTEMWEITAEEWRAARANL
jgi:RimJ/RimL family protein N-acetyltransferase